MRNLKYIVPVLMTLFCLGACDSSTQTANPETAPTVEKHALHAVSSEKLRVIMQNMYATVHDGGDMQDGKISEDKMADLIEAVEELLFHAEMLTVGKPEVKLDENELVTFRAMAGQLYTEALNLRQLTQYYDYHTIEPAYERLNQTCIACHSLFRGK